MKKLRFDPPDVWLAPPPPVWDPSTPAASVMPELLSTPEASPAETCQWRRRARRLTQVRAELVVAVAFLAVVALLVALARGFSDTPKVSLEARAFPPSTLGMGQDAGVEASPPAEVNPTRTAGSALARPMPNAGASSTWTPDRSTTARVEPDARQPRHVTVAAMGRPASTSSGSTAATQTKQAGHGHAAPKAPGTSQTPSRPKPSIAHDPRPVGGPGKRASDKPGKPPPSTGGPTKHRPSPQCSQSHVLQ